MAKSATPTLLVVEYEGSETRVEEFTDKIIKMGKLSSVNLRLEDPSVNRIHAVLEVHRNDAGQVIDMGSSKGTFVNDKRVQKSKISSGDVLTLANTKITVYIGEEAIAEYHQSQQPQVEEAAPVVEAPVEDATTVGFAPTAPPEQAAPAPVAEAPVEEATTIGFAPTGPPEQAAPAPAAPIEATTAATTAPAQPQFQQPQSFTGNAPAFQAPAQQQPQGGVYTTGSFAAPAGGTAAAPNPFGQPAQPQGGVYTTGSFAAPATSSPFGQPAQQQPQGGVYTTGSFAAPAVGSAAAPNPFGQAAQPQGGVYTTGSFAAPATGGFGQPAAPVAQAPVQQQNFGIAQTASPAANSFAGQSYSSPALSSPRGDGNHPEDTREALEVRMIWNNTVLDHSHFYEPQTITIGAGKSNTFAITNSALPADVESFPLVDVDGKNLVVNFTDQMSGSIERGGELRSLEELKGDSNVRRTSQGYQFVLPPKVFVKLHIAEITFELRFVTSPGPIAAGLMFQLDHHFARSMGISFLIHGMLVLMMLFSDENPERLKDGILNQNNRFTQLLLRPEKKEEKKKKKSGGSKAKGKKGKMGKKKDAPKVDRKAGQKKRNPDGTAPIDLKKLEKDLDSDMQNKGMLNALGGSKVMSSVIGAKGIGGADMNALGGWNGNKVGSAAGAGGLNVGGKGNGGGGLSGDSAGLGKLGTFGLGGGKGGIRGLRGKLKKRKRAIKFRQGNLSAVGCLDKKIIRRRISASRSSIKFCYERELAKNDKLQGTIKIYFVIGPNGKVKRSSVKSSTMNNDNVEQCIVRRVKYIRFSRLPKGCEEVHVNYPFVFKAS